MPVFYEIHLKAGGNDPRRHNEYAALCAELGKLRHPARPDVDWEEVERLSKSILNANGADLQTVAFYTLARSHLFGLDGFLEAVTMVKALTGEWWAVWPTTDQARIDVLNWLFSQLQSLLRSMEFQSWSKPVLAYLGDEIDNLSQLLAGHARVRLPALEGLRQQVAHAIRRALPPPADAWPIDPADYGVVSEIVVPRAVLHSPPAPVMPPLTPNPAGRWGLVRGFAAGAVVAALVTLGGWSLLTREAQYAGPPIAKIFLPEPRMEQPVSLNALTLFMPQSAELRPDSTHQLVDALLGIKARPGWLILIAGHSDSSGDPERNIQLSHARAIAVRDWLHKHSDIPSECFVVQGLGASGPVADNDTPAGRAANRRVEIRLIPGRGACALTARDDG